MYKCLKCQRTNDLSERENRPVCLNCYTDGAKPSNVKMTFINDYKDWKEPNWAFWAQPILGHREVAK